MTSVNYVVLKHLLLPSHAYQLTLGILCIILHYAHSKTWIVW
jgi:hypothetical protein